MPHLSEFDLIKTYFAPLSEGAPLAFGLRDDAALIRPPEGRDLVVTADCLVAGVHFLPEEAPGDIARKLMRVNLSDLAAKGAVPLAYVLTIAWPRRTESAWIAAFAEGLAADQAEFGLHLIGGDTVSGPGPLTLSLTAFGHVARGAMLKRSGAAPGDRVYVSGTIGDGRVGLQAARGPMSLSAGERDYVLARYRLPSPRLDLGQRLATAGATACIDISDGLVADAGHVAEASGVALTLEAARIPLSAAARNSGLDLEALVTGGDDYELLFTAPVAAEAALAALSRELGLALTPIGTAGEGEGVCLVDEGGQEIPLARGGYQHF